MDDDNAFNDSHRALVQAFLAQPVMSVGRVKEVVAELVSIHSGQDVTADTLPSDVVSDYLSQVSDKLSTLDYEIRSIMTQPDGKTTVTPENLYLLVNTASDQFTQLATAFTPDEIAFVKRVLDAMFETHNTPEMEVMAVKSTEAIRLAKKTSGSAGPTGASQTPAMMASFIQTQGDDDVDATMASIGGDATQQAATTASSSSVGITLDRAEKVLDMLVDQGWFLQSSAGLFSLAPRGIVELRSWLVHTYNYVPEDEDEDAQDGEIWQRIKTCEGCKEIVTVGQRCDEAGCSCRFHNHCASGFFTSSAQQALSSGGRAYGSETACPRCKDPWTGTKFVGERARDKGR